jgi:acetyl esterase/lipase
VHSNFVTAIVAAAMIGLMGMGQNYAAGDAASAPPPTLHPTVSSNQGLKIWRDLAYTSDNDFYRSLDIYAPEHLSGSKPPIIVLIHGGGWIGGDKDAFGGGAMEFARRGYVAASISYRLTGIKGLPIPILDCKSAIRWLRAHANDYGFDPNRIVVGGHSAGGHLAEFLAASNGVKKFDLGEYLNVSSDVQAAFPMAGVSDLTSWGPHGLDMDKCDDVSPVHWISKKSAPMYIVHGSDDKAVAVAQATELHEALDKAGITNELHIMPGEGHGSRLFMSIERLAEFDAFLAKTLKLGSNKWNASYIDKGPFTIDNVSAPEIVVTAVGSGTADRTNVVFDTPTGAPNQQWCFEDKGAGIYAIHPVYDKTLSLSVENGAAANRTITILEKDQGKPSQRWQVMHHKVGDLYFFLPQCAPHSALSDFAGQKAPGTAVEIWDYASSDPHMQFQVTAVKSKHKGY